MKQIYCREDEAKLQEIREELKAGRGVIVHNEYETFYGCGFDSWLRKGIEDIKCEIEVTAMNQWWNYPWEYRITPKNK